MKQQRRAMCAWCGTKFLVGGTVGRPPKYCKRSHRQRAFEASKRGSERGLGGGEVLVDATAWATLQDALYRLEAAVEDVATDLADGLEPRSMVDGLVRTCSDAIAALPEPIATGVPADLGQTR
ncbi:MAG: hypothetical protein GXP36_11470 [Actinobacteria bacterium]|nr:hypothetical protein [Actinomycetota bacterium]